MIRLTIVACLGLTGVLAFSSLPGNSHSGPTRAFKIKKHRDGAPRQIPHALQSVPRRQALRDVFRGAVLVAAAAGASDSESKASAVGAPIESGDVSRTAGSRSDGGAAAQLEEDAVLERSRLKEKLRIALRDPSLPPLASGSNREASINSLLDQLELLNPARGKWLYGGGEARGGGEEERASSSSRESDSFGSVASGSWRVAFAPHIAKFSGLAGVKFDPILYALNAPTNGIESHVQYQAPFGLQGWLNTRGVYGRRPPDNKNNSSNKNAVSFVEWEEAWWNPGAATEPGGGPSSGALAPIVSAIAKQGFVPAFANFPVSYLDRDLCVFVFPLSNTRIAAVPQGGILDPWHN